MFPRSRMIKSLVKFFSFNPSLPFSQSLAVFAIIQSCFSCINCWEMLWVLSITGGTQFILLYGSEMKQAPFPRSNLVQNKMPGHWYRVGGQAGQTSPNALLLLPPVLKVMMRKPRLCFLIFVLKFNCIPSQSSTLTRVCQMLSLDLKRMGGWEEAMY